jgi:hypothetical protein
MIVESRVWVRTEPAGEVIYVYVQTQVGSYAYRHRGNIIDMRNVIEPGLTNAQVEALFA